MRPHRGGPLYETPSGAPHGITLIPLRPTYTVGEKSLRRAMPRLEIENKWQVEAGSTSDLFPWPIPTTGRRCDTLCRNNLTRIYTVCLLFCLKSHLRDNAISKTIGVPCKKKKHWPYYIVKITFRRKIRIGDISFLIKEPSLFFFFFLLLSLVFSITGFGKWRATVMTRNLGSRTRSGVTGTSAFVSKLIKIRIGGDSDYPRWRHNRYVVNS